MEMQKIILAIATSFLISVSRLGVAEGVSAAKRDIRVNFSSLAKSRLIKMFCVTKGNSFYHKDDVRVFQDQRHLVDLQTLRDLVKTIVPLLKGKDGMDGRNGKDGIEGKDGMDRSNGKDGIECPRTFETPCHIKTLGELVKTIVFLLKGKDGMYRRNGKDGIEGPPGLPGPPGPPGPQGLPAKERHNTFTKDYFQMFGNWSLTPSTSHVADGMHGDSSYIIIPRAGRYFIYCQLYFLEEHSQPAGFDIVVNGLNIATKISQAGQSAYVGGVFLMQELAAISVVTRGAGIILGDPALTFFGATNV
ncbi:predicted protein [Nematostella vectensis]|uniref:THD domain-containing protein n=1 Tax=Nematostella vectensis TaxID=45351 RepID=A7RR09_NEMVE|nr:predicted protein [Nematostella vectensis]|eukprot:XP_001638094.1 predicted protein [Nematostella vectensis]